ncbi:hypothetical protein [Streptomyces sp. NPDC054838]
MVKSLVAVCVLLARPVLEYAGSLAADSFWPAVLSWMAFALGLLVLRWPTATEGSGSDGHRPVSRVGDSSAVCGDSVEDLVGGHCPDERPCMVVPVGEPGPDVAFECLN